MILEERTRKALNRLSLLSLEDHAQDVLIKINLSGLNGSMVEHAELDLVNGDVYLVIHTPPAKIVWNEMDQSISSLKWNKFEGSSEATGHIDQIDLLLNDARLTEWAEATDRNFMTVASQHLEAARRSIARFQEELEKAC